MLFRSVSQSRYASTSLILFASYALIAYAALVLFVADMKTQILPDSMLVVALIGIAMRDVFTHYGLEITDVYAAAGACLFFFLLWLVTRGRGMGLGDVKLAFVLGLFLGFPLIVIALYAGFLTGATVGVILILAAKKTMKSKIAFGPFLLFGGVVAFVWGQQLVTLWRSFL